MTGDARWKALFERIALFLTVLAFLMREGVPGATAGPGLNLFIHLLFWVALTLWFAGRAVGGGGSYRFTGFEFGFLGFTVFSLVSVLRASYKLTALDHALATLSLAFFFILAIQLLGARMLLSCLLATLLTLSIYALVQYFVLFPQLQRLAQTADSIEMARRIRTNEVFATFGGPNQWAAVLALLLPLAAGSMIDTREFRLRGAVLVLGLWALTLTGSKGGGVALACGALTMAGLAATRTRGRAAIVAAGAASVAVAVALLLWSPLLSALAKHSHSAHVRAVYWRATGPIIASAPLLGVGLDNWQDHFYTTKSDVQQETNKTHNDYLQVLSETGVLGFLAFTAILGLGLWKAFALDSASLEDPDPPSPWLVGGGVGILVLLGLAQAEDLIGHAIVFSLGALWLGSWLLLHRRPPAGSTQWTRIGAAGGFVALLVHMVVDFELYDYGVAAALVAMLALIAALRGDAVEIRFPRAVWLGATGILMALSLSLLTFISPRALAADSEIEEAKGMLALLERGSHPKPTQLLSDAIRVAEASQAHNPFNPDAYQVYARAKMYQWGLTEKVGARDPKDLDAMEGTVLQALHNAIALRPLSSPLHDERAHAHRLFWRHYVKLGKDQEFARVQAAEHLRLSVEEQRRAYELYPTICRNAYLLARILELAGDPEAKHYYQEALRLGDLAGKELEDLDRLKLSPLAKARSLRAVGHPLEAHEVLDMYLRPAVQGLPPEKARAQLERFVKRSEEEMDEGMTPVLKDVVEAILRDLK
jgi:O-antigen ligase